MAPGAVQHFCHRDERSLDFTFPGSDRPQNYGPELLFPAPVTSPDESVSLLLTLSSARHCWSPTRGASISVPLLFLSTNCQQGLHAPVARAVEVPVFLQPFGCGLGPGQEPGMGASPLCHPSHRFICFNLDPD